MMRGWLRILFGRAHLHPDPDTSHRIYNNSATDNWVCHCLHCCRGGTNGTCAKCNDWGAEISTPGHPEDAGSYSRAWYCIITVSNDAAEMHSKLNYITHTWSIILAAAAEMALNFRHLAISVFISFYNYSRISAHNDGLHINKHTHAELTGSGKIVFLFFKTRLGRHEFVRTSKLLGSWRVWP